MTRSLNDWDREIARKPVRNTIGAGVLILIVIGVLAVVGGAGSWFINLASQPGRIVTQTLDANNVIDNYEYFRAQYADIQGMEPQIRVVAAEKQAIENLDRARWTRATEERYNQLSAQLTGLESKRIRMIQEYNGKASQANRSIFLAGLPDNIPLN